MRKIKRRPNTTASLNLTSMMDMMTIILVFLLKNFSTNDLSVAPSEHFEIPLSSAAQVPRLAVNVVVTRSEVVVDGERVLALTEAFDERGEAILAVPSGDKRGQLILLLHDRLIEKAEIAKALAGRQEGEDFAFKGEMLLQCDRRVPFSVLREVMFTAGQAGFGNFRFVVIKMGG